MIYEPNEKDVTRFMSKVSKKESGCWEWVGSCNGHSGYGQFYMCRNGKIKTFTAHRVSYFIRYGSFDESLFVCHKCDNRKCVNPDHLFLGLFVKPC